MYLIFPSLNLSLKMSRHGHWSRATNITSNIHWELKRRHHINSFNSHKTPAMKVIMCYACLAIISCFTNGKLTRLRDHTASSDPRTLALEPVDLLSTCYWPWAGPLLLKGHTVFHGANVPSSVLSPCLMGIHIVCNILQLRAIPW